MGSATQKSFLVSKETCFSIIGLTAYWPLMRRSSYQALFVDDAFYLAFAIFAVLSACAMLVMHKSINRSQIFKTVALIISAVASLISALGALGIFDPFERWVWLLGASFYGISFSMLTAEWGQQLVRYDISKACLVAFGSFSVALILTLVSAFFNKLSIVLIITLPTISACLLLYLRPVNLVSETVRVPKNQIASQPLVFIFVVFLISGSIFRGLYYTSQSRIPLESMAIMQVLTILFCLLIFLVVASSRRQKQQRPIFLQAWMIITVIFFTGLLITMVFSQEWRQSGEELTLVSRMMFSVLLWLVLISVAQSNHQSILMMSFWTIAEMASSLIAYFLIPQLAAYFPSLVDSILFNALLTLILLVVLIAASFFFLQRVIINLERSRAVEVASMPHNLRCERIADVHGLTARELEILILYSQGSSSRSIAEKLYISPETVRTHVKSIYGKVGVNKKQGLIDLIQRQD